MKNLNQRQALNQEKVYIFDTNCLLNYVYDTGDKSTDFLKTLKKMGKQNEIRYSNQVLLEVQSHSKNRDPKTTKSIKYIKNEKIEINELIRNIDILVDAHNASTDSGSSKKQYSISVLEESRKGLKEIKNKLVSWSNGNTFFYYDNNKQLIDYLLSGLPMLDNYSDIIEKYEWITEGFARISHNIPPAYEDSYQKKFPYVRGNQESSKRTITHKCDSDESIRYLGDFFIWKEILKSLQQGNSLWGKDVVFVTNDTKADWFIEKHDPVENAHNRKHINRCIRPELKEEFKKTVKRNGGIGNIEFITLQEWNSIFTEKQDTQKVVDVILELTKHKDSLNTLIDTWQLKDKVSDLLRELGESELYDDSSYAEGMYMDDVNIDDCDDLDVSIDNVYTEDGLYYISGEVSTDAEAQINASYDQDDEEISFGENFDYNVSGRFNFLVEFVIDAKDMTFQDNNSFRDDILEQMQRTGSKIVLDLLHIDISSSD